MYRRDSPNKGIDFDFSQAKSPDYFVESIRASRVRVNNDDEIRRFIKDSADSEETGRILSKCAHFVRIVFPLCEREVELEYDPNLNECVFRLSVNDVEPVEPVKSRVLNVYDMLYPEFGISWLDKLYITIGR